jgi:hypothetical protein
MGESRERMAKDLAEMYWEEYSIEDAVMELAKAKITVLCAHCEYSTFKFYCEVEREMVHLFRKSGTFGRTIENV